jgi:hypothetical protein
MSYTFSSTTTDTSGTTVSTVSLDIGPTASPTVIVAVACPGVSGTPTLTVGGAAMTLQVSDGSDECFVFSGVASGSGVQSVVFTATGSAFQQRNYCLWYTTDTITVFGTGSTTAGGQASYTVSVPAGGYLFAIAASTQTTPTLNGSTQTPTANHSIATGGTNFIAADWVIASGNASFTVATSPAGNEVSSAVSFTVAAPPAFVTIGIGGSNW